jgi:exosome complex exonuclease RRP6
MDFGQQRDSLLNKLVSLTQSAKFLQPSEVLFMRSDKNVNQSLDRVGDKLLSSINETIEFSSKNADLFDGPDDIQDRFQLAIELMDNLFEKANVFLDSTKKKNVQIVLGENLNTSKPQLKFKDKVNNTNTIFVPILTYKPNAKKPLATKISNDFQEHISNFGHTSNVNSPDHPYQYEIETIEYPKFMFQKKQEKIYSEISSEPCWVDTVQELELMCKHLGEVTEMAVDLEHHDARSFIGFTCLMQISTRTQDFLVDTLALRSELHVLNHTFTNPKILKVFHGAEMDIQWLQRGTIY